MRLLKTPHTIALISILAALCLAIQLAPRPPNVEFTSLLAFVVGFLFGAFTGIFFGSFVMFVNGFLSPWGFAGLNMPFQMVGMSLMGLTGGLYRTHLQDISKVEFYVEASILGAFLTVVYDIVTNLGVALSITIGGINPSLAIVMALAYGAPFSLIHVVSNTVIFGIVFFPLIQALNQIQVVRNQWLKKGQ